MNQLTFDIFIPRESKEAALAAIKSLHGREREQPYGPADFGIPHFSFVQPDDYLKAQDLETAMRAWRWAPEIDEDGNIIALEFTGEKWGAEDFFFSTIAPFVRPGSSIQMVGEDGAIWRWLFLNGKAHYQNGKVVFPDDTAALL